MPGASVTGVLDVATVAALRSVQLCRQLDALRLAASRRRRRGRGSAPGCAAN